MVRKSLVLFMNKNRKRPNRLFFRIEKVIKKVINTLLVKWEGYNNFFSSWINVNDILKQRVNISLNRQVVLVGDNATKSGIKKATGFDISLL